MVNSDPILSTASEVYREIKNRGLHLRKTEGRDNALLKELERKLGCTDGKLQSYLDSSALTAMEFMVCFLRISRPFSRMFADIWEYMSDHSAPVAGETISIRFGLPEDPQKEDVDLEKFRRYIMSSTKVYSSVEVRMWPPEAMNKLFPLSNILIKNHSIPEHHYHSYRPGTLFKLPELTRSTHPLDEVVQSVHSLFEKIIGESVKAKLSARLDELIKRNVKTDEIVDAAWHLTDLLPKWFTVFSILDQIGASEKDEALTFYRKEILPLLQNENYEQQLSVSEALDVLELPFWKHRWHTYEIWCTVKSIRILEEYGPVPRVLNGKIPFDGYSAEIIADLNSEIYPNACMAVQAQTPFVRNNRTAIKPDLRICFDSSITEPAKTAGIIEFKQRSTISKGHVEEVASAYKLGSPNGGGVIILNYDITGLHPKLEPDCYYVEGVQPENSTGMHEFRMNLLAILERASLKPTRGGKIVLLDVSASMEGLYDSETVQVALRTLLSISTIRIYRFNDGLVPDYDLLTPHDLSASGGTFLGKALNQIHELHEHVDRILLVTDGDHGNPIELKKINVKECTPSELGSNLGWIMNE